MSANKKILIGTAAAALVLVIAGLLYVLVYKPSHPPVPEELQFRDEYGLVLNDYDKNPVHLAAYKHKALIAYAWASWCPYCGAEIENLAALKKVYAEDIQIVAINRAEPLQVAKAYTDNLRGTAGITFLLDPEDSFFKLTGGYAMPETVFINERGEITYHQRGPIDIKAVEERIKGLLGRQ